MTLKVQGKAVHKPGVTWGAASRDDLVSATDTTNELNLNGVTTMSWWADSDGDRTLGVAWVTALCDSFSTNLNEKQSTVTQSAFVRKSYGVQLHSALFFKIFNEFCYDFSFWLTN